MPPPTSQMSLRSRSGGVQVVVRYLFNKMWTLILRVFFNQIEVLGKENIPTYGPTIVVGNHNNQFVDGILLNLAVNQLNRDVQFLIAEKSWNKAGIGHMAAVMGCIPIARAQDNAKQGVGTITATKGSRIVEGLSTLFTVDLKTGDKLQIKKSTYVVDSVDSDTVVQVSSDILESVVDETDWKIAPKIDQANVYHRVWDTLNGGGCIGIFPEGGSHDRPELLPLQAGVTIMALGALSTNPKMPLKIVPCGLNYYSPHKFRSRVVVQFGPAIEVDESLVEMYKSDKKAACSQLLKQITESLKGVIFELPNYQSQLMVHNLRRMYQPIDRHLTVKEYHELNRRFGKAMEVFGNTEEFKVIQSMIQDYRDELKELGLTDLQVMRMQQSTKYDGRENAKKLVFRVVKLITLVLLSIPGLILCIPIGWICDKYAQMKKVEAKKGSSVKLEGLDVLATWKILAGMFFCPFFSILYSTMFAFTIFFLFPTSSFQNIFLISCLFASVLPICGYYSIIFSDDVVRLKRTIKPLYLNCIGKTKGKSITEMRHKIQQMVRETVDKFGPLMYGSDFESIRIVKIPSSNNTA